MPTNTCFLILQVLEYFREQIAIGAEKEAAWNELYAAYAAAHPDLVCIGPAVS